MPYKEFYFLDLQHHNEAAIVVEFLTVCGSSRAPLIGIDEGQPSSQIAKESMA